MKIISKADPVDDYFTPNLYLLQKFAVNFSITVIEFSVPGMQANSKANRASFEL